MSAGDPLGLSGKVLHEQFHVNELADESPRAFLYKGTEISREVPVAIKFLKGPPSLDPGVFVKRFRHEMRLHYALSQASPHVVRIHAGGSIIPPETSTLTPFTVLEWLKGRTLAADFAERRAHWGTGRSIEEAIVLLDPAVEALAIAHFHNVVHREVTPANLFLTGEGDATTIKVLDFGLAKVLGETTLDVGQRSATIDMGPLTSPIYAAPEQFSRDAGAVGPAADLYSLTMIFLEALRDKPVMDDSSSPLAVRVLDASKRPTPRALGINVGANLELVLAEAVAVKADQRPKEIGEFWANLKRAALKDARVKSISSPPSMRSRADSDDADETEVAINLSFARPSAVDTVPHPEPETLSRPFNANEPLSSTGEMFAMLPSDIAEAPITSEPVTAPASATAPPSATIVNKTLVSAKHIEPKNPEKRVEIGLKPTLVSGVPVSTRTQVMPRDVVPSTAAPFTLAKRETPIIPMTEGPRDLLKRASLNPQVALDQQQAENQQVAPASTERPAWVTALLVFVIVATGLAAVVAAILR